MLRILATAALLALTVTAAQADDAPASVNVAFGDLNLSHPADAKILAERLQTAAAQVCRSAGSGQPAIPAMHTTRECMHDAIDVALARIASAQTNAVRANLVSSREALALN